MRQAFQHEKPGQDVDERFLSLVSARAKVSSGWWMQFGMPTEGRQTMKGTPWVVVEADDKQTIQKEFGKGEILDQFPYKGHSVFLVQSPSAPSLPNTVLEGPIYGVGVFRDERTARTLAKRLTEI